MTMTDSGPPAPAESPVQAPAPIPQDAGRRARRLAAEAGVPADISAPAAVEGGKSSRKGRRPLSTGRGIAAWVLASVSLLLLWFVFYAVVLTPFQEQHAQSVLYNTMRQKLSQQVAPLGGPIVPGTPVALISAPALGISDVVVVEGTASGDLMAGPGHRGDTVLPGQSGVAVLYGRASLFGGPFANLRNAHAGEQVTVTTGQGVFHFQILGRRVAGDPLPAPLADGGARMTLVSATGSGRLGSLTPDGTIYVDAQLTGQSQPSPPGRATAVPKAERAMQGDPSALLPLALSLPLLVAAVLFLAWARDRWGGWQTWLIGTPILLATLWLVSQAAVQLLPNLL